MRLVRITRFLLVLLLLAAVPLRTHAAEATGSLQFNPPKQFYLALGDSLAFGYQQSKDLGPGTPASAFTTGYVDDFAQMLAAVRPGIQTENLACSGETTVTFTQGGCQHPEKRHITYAGSQLSAALAFLSDHPGQVSPITIDLGADDILALSASCGLGNILCLSLGVQQAVGNLGPILSALRQAAPYSEIIVLQYYNPFALLNPTADFLNPLVEQANSLIAMAALGQRDRLADAFTPFNLAPQPGTLCTLTGICTALQDIHPTDAGYLVIAQQFWASSGYSRLGN